MMENENVINSRFINNVKKILENRNNIKTLQSLNITSVNELIGKSSSFPDYLESQGVVIKGDRSVQEDEKLNSIIAVKVSGKKGKEETHFFGLEGSEIEGYIGFEETGTGKVELSEEAKKKVKGKIDPELRKLIAKKVYDSVDKKVNNAFSIDDIWKNKSKFADEVLGTFDLSELKAILERDGGLDKFVSEKLNSSSITEKIDRLAEEITEKLIDNENNKNGKTRKEREDIERKANGNRIEVKTDKSEEQLEGEAIGNINKNYEMLQSICGTYGISMNQVKDTCVVKASELRNLIDTENHIDPNAGDITIIQVKSGEASGPDRYFAIQNGKMVLFGHREDNDYVHELFGDDNKRLNGGFTEATDENDRYYIFDKTMPPIPPIEVEGSLSKQETRDLVEKLSYCFMQAAEELADVQDVNKRIEIIGRYEAEAESIAVKANMDKSNFERIKQNSILVADRAPTNPDVGKGGPAKGDNGAGEPKGGMPESPGDAIDER